MPSRPMRARFTLLVAGLVVGAGVLAYVLLIDADSAGPDAARLALGRQVYDAHCAACHGVDLEGQTNWRQRGADGLLPAPPHDATGHTWHHPDEQLFAMTKYGIAALAGADYKTAMTGFGDQLSDNEIRAILDYIKSRWPADIHRRQAEITARARQD